jgi:hypothetical protein
MRLAAHQPAYLPWLGYLDKIASVDVFVYLDTVQFEKNSYTNRNRIKTPQGVQWLTVPVRQKGHITQTLEQTEIDETKPWRSKNLKSVAMSYARAGHFRECFEKLEALHAEQDGLLAGLCWKQLRFWLEEFAIATEIVRASELPVSGRKSGLILELCRHFGVDYYLSGSLGRDYLQADEFAAAGVHIAFQDYVSPVYPQLWGEFVPNLSVVDYWMNCGARPFQETFQ